MYDHVLLSRNSSTLLATKCSSHCVDSAPPQMGFQQVTQLLGLLKNDAERWHPLLMCCAVGNLDFEACADLEVAPTQKLAPGQDDVLFDSYSKLDIPAQASQA